MLHRYQFKNFFSFREEAEISFLLNKHAPEDRRSFTCATGQRLSKVIAVIGPNASGKTNAIKPLAFIAWFLRDSFRIEPNAKLLLKPHFFSDDQVSRFTLEFDWNNALWRYQVSLMPDRVLSESLYRKTSRLFSYVFEREWQPENESYLIKQQGFGLNKREAEKVRENVSLISWAAQYDVRLARMLATPPLYTNMDFIGRRYIAMEQVLRAADFFANEVACQDQASLLLKDWDLGLTAMEIHKVKVTQTKTGETNKINLPFGIHRSGSRRVRLPLFEESSGTQGAFVLLARLLPALRSGGIVVIDEMEADLHPHMLNPILDLFFNEKTNPHNAQIIFTCHSMEILNLLHKAQVVLVQKDENCESEAWRLDEMQGVRADDNLYAKYMAGTYGAIPSF